MTEGKLLSVRNLSLEIVRRDVGVVKDVSFDVAPGEIFGIVGESGSGKSLATRAIVSLLPPVIRRRQVRSSSRAATSPQLVKRTCARCVVRRLDWFFRSP